MELNLKNLIKANGLTLKFALNYFIESCVENEQDQAEYCWYLIKAKGVQILIDLLKKFKDKIESCENILKVIFFCLNNYQDQI